MSQGDTLSHDWLCNNGFEAVSKGGMVFYRRELTKAGIVSHIHYDPAGQSTWQVIFRLLGTGMMFSPQDLKDRDAALAVLHSDPPSDTWFRLWEDWFVKQAGEPKSGTIEKLFAYARKGAGIEADEQDAAKREVAEMLESLARQIRRCNG
jgi:hypothetical protein